MSLTSVLSPISAWRADFPDVNNIDTFSTVAVKNLFAPRDGTGSNVSLRLGATSNLVLEAAGNAETYLKDGHGMLVYNSTFTADGQRSDHQLLDLRSNIVPYTGHSATVIHTGAGSNVMWVHGNDADKTVWVGEMRLRKFNNHVQLSTPSQSNGFRITNTTTFDSNVVVTGNSYHKSTMEVDGNVTFFSNFFTKNMNLWSDSTSSNATADAGDSNVHSRVGFGMRINDRGELELIKHAEFPGGQKVQKKVAVFGNSPLKPNEKTDGTSYLVFDSLVGVGVHNGESVAGSMQQIGYSNVLNGGSWVFSPAGDVTTTGAVGIGVTQPMAGSKLHVDGDVLVTTLNATDIQTQSIVTTSDERLKDIRATLAPANCLAKVCELDVIDYAYKQQADETRDGRFRAGLRAQQVRSVMSDAVIEKKFASLDDCLLIDNSVLLAYLIGAVKELAERLP